MQGAEERRLRRMGQYAASLSRASRSNERSDRRQRRPVGGELHFLRDHQDSSISFNETGGQWKPSANISKGNASSEISP